MTSRQYETMIQSSHDFITMIDREYRYEFVTDSYARELGMPVEELLGKTVAEVWGETIFKSRIKRRVDRCFKGKECHDTNRFMFGKNTKYIDVSYFPYGEGKGVTHVMIFSQDISQMKELESKLQDFEFKDPVTGLFNRRSFDIVLDMEIEKAKRADADGSRAVMFINLRNLSGINATFGFELGNLLLEATALRIKDALRSSDHVFRFDGKEFAVILSTIKRGADIPLIAENIRAKADFPYSHKGTIINIACNIGASVFPNDGDSREAIISHAVAAMNDARDRNESLVMFNKDLYELGKYKARLRSDMGTAFVERQFRLAFQPIVDVSGMIVGAEALIRWQHAELGNIPPDKFIPIAEESGNIAMIGKWVLFQVCRDIRRFGDDLRDRYVSVNLSSREFGSPAIVKDIGELLESEGISAASLKLEITEGQSVADLDAVIDKIRRLSDLGVDVLIDDFGTGYSSLGYIKRLPAKTIKIDKSFVDSIVESDEDLSFIRGLISMIESKKKNALVEGVEALEQYLLLREIGARFMQGYYFSKPCSAEAFHGMLKSREPLPQAG